MDNSEIINKKSNKKLYVILAIVGNILFLSGVSYAVLTLTLQGTAENILTSGGLELTLTEGNALSLTSVIPLTDEDGKLGESFDFTLENTGVMNAGYKLYLDDLPLEAGENRVPGTDLRYELIMNGVPVRMDNLSNDTTEIYVGNISANTTVSFEFRMWIDYDVTSLPSNGTHRSSIRIEASQIVYDGSNAAPPEVVSDLIPVVYNDIGEVIKADTTVEWHNYDKKEWANAVTVTDATKSIYANADPGTEILMDDIENMLVWIPRYAYDINSITGADEAIDITFVDTTVRAHSAFTFGEDELSGFWVGKFEMGFKAGESENTVNVSYLVKPNLNSVHSTNVSTLYDKINDITIDNSDVHMMKNTEWGAVAYLSQSKYGVCNVDGTCTTKVANNAYYIDSTYDISTGCGPVMNGSTMTDDALKLACPQTSRWNYETGQLASTTHNMYGVYDMAGGRHEYVMGNMKNSSGLFSATEGFSSAPDAKYYDAYEYGLSSDYSRGLLGDATVELQPTSSPMAHWNADVASFVNVSNYWFLRGGHSMDTSFAGVFRFYSSGISNSIASARLVASFVQP